MPGKERLCKIGHAKIGHAKIGHAKNGNKKRRAQLIVDGCIETHGAVSAWRGPGVASGWTRMVLRVAL